MTTSRAGVAADGFDPRAPHRALGTLGMLASPALLAVGLLEGFDDREPSRTAALLQLLFLGGWASSVVGLRRLRAAGRGTAGRVLLAAQLAGLALAATQELQDLLLPAPDRAGLAYRVADAAWPLSVLYMLVVGAGTARARVLAGWRRFAPLLCGFTLPVAVAAGGIAGRAALQYVFPVLTTAAWLALGYGVRMAAPPQAGVRDGPGLSGRDDR